MLSPLLALALGTTTVLAQTGKGGEGHVGGSFEDGGNTVVSAMMVLIFIFRSFFPLFQIAHCWAIHD